MGNIRFILVLGIELATRWFLLLRTSSGFLPINWTVF